MTCQYITDNVPATFEEAIKQTKFGKFNVMLVALSICGIFSSLFETTTMSYIFAPAHCELQLSLQDKGYLNSACYAGMISSSFIWGYLLDVLGRRRLMICGYFLDASFVFLSGFSQSFKMLVISKFFGGLIINGPFSAMPAYLSEFHSSNYRSRIQLASGTITNIAQILLPLLAWAILPLSIDLSFFNGVLEIRSWNLFLLITGFCPLISGICFIFLPESPKFLMTIGKNDKALKILQKVYTRNTGKPVNTYQITELVQEVPSKRNKIKNIDKNMVEVQCEKSQAQSNIFSLFKSPFVFRFLLVVAIQTACMSSLNMLRLWSPQLFQALEDYKVKNNGTISDLCTMLTVLTPESPDEVCVTYVSEPGVYINSMIVAATGVLLYILIGFIINILGKKNILIVMSGVGSVTCFGVYFAHGTILTTILIAFFIGAGNVCINVCLGVVVDLFPTTLRAFTVSLVMALARIGAVIGNVVFPYLLELGCAPPFFVVGGILAAGCLLCFLLPNTENKALQ